MECFRQIENKKGLHPHELQLEFILSFYLFEIYKHSKIMFAKSYSNNIKRRSVYSSLF